MAARNRSLSSVLRDALWEYQGTTTLSAGVHWIRLQDVLPEIVGLRLEPAATAGPPNVPWRRYAVPEGDFLGRAEAWQVERLFGRPEQTAIRLDTTSTPALRFSTAFANVARGDLSAGDCVRLRHGGTWDLEPFGRLRFRFQGQGTGHIVTLWAVDVKSDEKLLWRIRDVKAGVQDISVPISFEGNDVFDPGHAAAICLELDEGNVKVDQVNRFAGAIIGPVFDRRDPIVPPQGYADSLAAAHRAMAELTKSVREKPAAIVARGFQPWTKPVVPEEHPLYAKTEPKPVTRKTVGYDLHCTGSAGHQPRRVGAIPQILRFRQRLLAAYRHLPATSGVCQGRGLSGRTSRHGETAGRRAAPETLPVRYLGLRAFRSADTHRESRRSTMKSSPEFSASGSSATITASRTAATSARTRPPAIILTASKDGTVSSAGTSTFAATACTI